MPTRTSFHTYPIHESLVREYKAKMPNAHLLDSEVEGLIHYLASRNSAPGQ